MRIMKIPRKLMNDIEIRRFPDPLPALQRRTFPDRISGIPIPLFGDRCRLIV